MVTGLLLFVGTALMASWTVVKSPRPLFLSTVITRALPEFARSPISFRGDQLLKKSVEFFSQLVLRIAWRSDIFRPVQYTGCVKNTCSVVRNKLITINTLQMDFAIVNIRRKPARDSRMRTFVIRRLFIDARTELQACKYLQSPFTGLQYKSHTIDQCSQRSEGPWKTSKLLRLK